MIIALIPALALESCCAYQSISVDRRHSLFRSDAAGGRKLAARYRVAVARVFARKCSLSPVAVINNKAVDLARQGRYSEAEILFREVLAEEGLDPAAHNNLGIICEINGSRDEAFRMYMEACRLEPGNIIFRNNFQNFAGFSEGKD